MRALGGFALENWQLERLIDDAHEPPAFNCFGVSVNHAMFDSVRFCQSRNIEVIALLGGPEPPDAVPPVDAPNHHNHNAGLQTDPLSPGGLQGEADNAPPGSAGGAGSDRKSVV